MNPLDLPPGLSESQVRALEILASCCDENAVISELGISRSTMWRWLNKEPEFANAWRLVRTRRVEHALSLMQLMSLKAAATLGRLLDCEQPQVQLLAARTILDYGAKAVELFDIKRRIAEIEHLLEKTDDSPMTPVSKSRDITQTWELNPEIQDDQHD